MSVKRNHNLCIVRHVFGTDVEIHLTEHEVRVLYDEVCRASTKAHVGKLRKEFPKMPNEHEVHE